MAVVYTPYNILFAPATATIMPTTPAGVAQAASYLIFWLFAVIQQQVYWRIPQLVDNSAGVGDSISVDLTQLAQLYLFITTTVPHQCLNQYLAILPGVLLNITCRKDIVLLLFAEVCYSFFLVSCLHHYCWVL